MYVMEEIGSIDWRKDGASAVCILLTAIVEKRVREHANTSLLVIRTRKAQRRRERGKV